MNFAQFFAVTAILTGIFFAGLYSYDKRKERRERDNQT
jgi:hypothetical protein